ncbi:hypothetical protein TNIN_146281 [Trichonephila inaurata madagascariensis]|uniref:Uncharacterized protein n=1 Tax=Trichonephila inaurata madagascariensis TaxID=2747483 RepID=A0A8X6YUM2_9ARAC|nr:hypothetical protein TNIN_146281 [Trichonephila inaurata madagascariensis]
MEVYVGPAIKQRKKSCSHIFERKTFGPVQGNNEWRILYNHKIYRKYGKYGWTDIVRTMRPSRIRCWTICTDIQMLFLQKKVTFSKTEGTIHRERWLDNVENDLKLMGTNRWKAFVTHRVNWRRISESALACKSC